MKFTKKQHLQIISIIVILLATALGEVNLNKELQENLNSFFSSPEISKNSSQVAGTTQTQAVVTRIIDGDTIELNTGEKLRYIGIDTPETKHPTKEIECFGQEATQKNTELLLGKNVVLEKDVSDVDRYGRLLRYVYIDNVMINELLVREGYALAVSFPPDIKYQDTFRSAEKLAREERKGLWGNCELE